MATSTHKKRAAVVFASRLRAAMSEQRVSVRELARRVSASEHVSFETARTNLHRLMRAEHVPTRATRDSLTDALSLERGALDEDEEESLAAVPTNDLLAELFARANGAKA